MSLKLLLRPYLRILIITITGFIAIMVGMAILGLQISNEITELTSQAIKFNQHPFKVSAAARDARFYITKIRIENLSAVLDPANFEHAAFNQEIKKYEASLDNNLSIIESNFLGDMDKVREARDFSRIWHKERAEQINLIVNGRNTEAAYAISTKDTSVYEALQARMDYIAAFSSKKADDLVIQAQERSEELHIRLWYLLLAFTLFILIAGGATIMMVLSSLYQRDMKLLQANNNLQIAATAFESQEGMFVTDANSIILRVNQAFIKITGYSAEDAVGKKTQHMFSSGRENRSLYAAMWDRVNNTGTWSGEVRNKRKNGEVYPGHLTITAVKDAAGIVRNHVGTFTDITKSKAASEVIINLAYYDPLTQLPNRRLLLDRLAHALAASARSSQRGGLLYLDLDHFKTLNDTLGHDVGDLLLQQVAARLTASVREGDTVARLGGDEFVVLLEDLSHQVIEAAAQTKDVAEKTLLTLNQPYQLNTHTYHSTPSIGAILFNGHEFVVDELLKKADIAMYQSKTEGRNTIRFFDPMMQEIITARADMGHELRKAIEQNQFQLHYQIQVDCNGQAQGAEALIRWLHPERGIISPLNFIPLAEETGLILPIGQWVIDAACAQLKIWQQNLLTKDLVLAVNVSAKQFHQEDFVEQVLATTQRHGINSTCLKLELTESMLVDNINDIIIKMDALSKIGIQFSLDDFGTGYSSLQYLKNLPLNQLKIDQSFIRDITTDSSDRTIVRTIITMAHSLDINVIAEGVEAAEQRHYLLDNGCMNYQGYLFSKPVPIDEFEALLRTS